MTDVGLLQLGGLIVLLFLTYYTYLEYRRKVFKKLDFILWSLVWVFIIIIELFPQIFTPLIQSTVFFRVLDIIVIFSIGSMFIACFYIYHRLRIIEAKTKTLVKVYAEKSVLEKDE